VTQPPASVNGQPASRMRCSCSPWFYSVACRCWRGVLAVRRQPAVGNVVFTARPLGAPLSASTPRRLAGSVTRLRLVPPQVMRTRSRGRAGRLRRRDRPRPEGVVTRRSAPSGRARPPSRPATKAVNRLRPVVWASLNRISRGKPSRSPVGHGPPPWVGGVWRRASSAPCGQAEDGGRRYRITTPSTRAGPTAAAACQNGWPATSTATAYTRPISPSDPWSLASPAWRRLLELIEERGWTGWSDVRPTGS